MILSEQYDIIKKQCNKGNNNRLLRRAIYDAI